MNLSMILAAGCGAAILATAGTALAAPGDTGWAGPYAGGSLGYAAGQGRFSGLSGVPNTDIHGPDVGLDLGANWEAGSIVYGVEGEAAYVGAEGSRSASGIGFKTETQFVGTLRGRVGVAEASWLPYVVGGVAIGDIKTTVYGASSAKTVFGWTAGFGLEHALKYGWSMRLEYSFLGFGKTTAKLGGVNVADTIDLSRITVELDKNF